MVRTQISLDADACRGRSDREHAVAADLFSDPPRRWYSSLAIVSETYGWSLHRLGEDAARTFRRALEHLPRGLWTARITPP